MIKAIIQFKDMEADCIREIGDKWETSAKREEMLVGMKFAEKVGEPKVAEKKPVKAKVSKTVREKKTK